MCIAHRVWRGCFLEFVLCLLSGTKAHVFLCVSAIPADSGQFSKHCSPQTSFLRAVCPSRRALCFPHCLLWPLGRVTLEPHFSTLHPGITWKERADGEGLWSSRMAALLFLQVFPSACWSRAGGSKATTTQDSPSPAKRQRLHALPPLLLHVFHLLFTPY